MSELSDMIKERLDIVDVASRYVSLRKSGSNFVGLSPFKSEKTPSFVVSPHKQIFKCFSSGLGGNVITLVMEIEKIDYMDAVRMLADIGGVDLSQFSYDPEKHKQREGEKEKIKRMQTIAQDYFVAQLHQQKMALDYLHQRGVNDEIIKEFGIGYAPDSMYEMITLLKKQGFIVDDLVSGSLAKKGQGGDAYSFFRKRIMIPIKNHIGKVIGFGARALEKDQQPKYVNSADSIVYDKSKILYNIDSVKQHVKEFDYVIVVEGYFDVIALAIAGLPIGVATCGTSLTTDHIKLLKRYTDNVYFLFDSDTAGQQATVRGLKIAYKEGVYPKVLSLPDAYKDIDELVQHATSADETVQELMSNAHDGLIWLYNLLRKQFDPSSPVERQKMMAQYFDVIYHLDSVTLQSDYLAIISEKLGSRHEYVVAQYKQYIKKERSLQQRRRSSSQKQPSGAYQLSKDVLLAGLLSGGESIAAEKKELIVGVISRIITTSLESLAVRVVKNDTFTDEEQQQLDEAQLWWQKELEEVNDVQQQRNIIKTVILDYVNQLAKIAMKQLSSPQEKQDLNNQLITLIKM